ncbi:MAG: BamA/TamA family outer membrane protein [Lewinella sp.]|uniref:translocation and assembly module lipoprotein TamL n=1 Tax=Lewinella sp. TaxID=2004506 RepID=UPI003D6AF990
MPKIAVWTVKYAIPVILLLVCCSSCNSTKFLEQSEYLLDKNQVLIKEKMEGRSDLAYELSTFYRQSVNSNFFFLFPREYAYLNNSAPDDTTGWKRFKRETIGEPPTIYSDSLTTLTAQDMQTYLHYKGYLQAQVIPQRSLRKKKMQVSYYALPGPRYYIDSVNFHSPDKEVDRLLQLDKEQSYFKSGDPLDLSRFNQEKTRITSHMRNNGFAEFYQTQIGELELDTFQMQEKANVYVTVYPPFGDTTHQQFYIGEIEVYLDFAIDKKNILSDTTIAGLHFFLTERGFIVNPSTLRKAISLRPGELFSQENYNQTNDQLSELGIFRFVRIKQEPDPIDKDVIHLSIQLTPNYLFEINTSLELNYTNRSNALNNNLIGMSLNPGVVHRNFLGGAELFSANLSAGVEVAPQRIGGDDFWNTVDLRADFDLTLPQFVDYLGLWRSIYRIPSFKDKRLIGRDFYRTLRNKATTHIGAGYEYLLIFNWYSYDLLNLSYGYEVQPSRFERYSIDHFAINFLNPSTDTLFEFQLKENGFLERSFGQQVFISLLFRNFDFTRRSKTTLRGRTTYLNANIEIAGAEVYGINQLYNEISGENSEFKLGSDIAISQFARSELELRYQKQVTTDQAFVARFNIGAAVPFGAYTSDVPYVKQYFVGGANSMRAWAPRGLGPGGFQDPLANSAVNNFRLFQTGDFKLEMNMEYRFPIFLRIKGAIFADVGNVWTFEEDLERPGSQLKFGAATPNSDSGLWYYPFYKQLAIAGGMGLRVDLSYFIFRFDVGAKLRNNAPSFRDTKAPESAWWNDFRDIDTNDFGFNFGLGFPF